MDRLKKIISEWKNPRKNVYYDFDNISNYFYNKKINDFVSDSVVNDIDLDDIFIYIDRTTSKIGQQYLYFKLRNYQKDEDITQLSNIFREKPQLREKIQVELSALNNRKAYEFEKLFHTNLIKPKQVKYYKYLFLFTLLILLLSIVNKAFLLLIIPIFLINFALHYKNKNYTSYFFDGISQMLIAYKTAKNILKNKEIDQIFDDKEFLNKINDIKKKSIFIVVGEKLNQPSLIIFWLLFELIKIFFNLESIVFFSLMDYIKENKKHIEKLFVFIGKIDTAISIIGVEKSNQTCKPVYVDKKTINVENIYHPLIQNCVKNNFSLNGKSLLLTGSNMSGKTTFIRTIAINTILGKNLNFCFADKFEIPPMQVLSSIRISDDLFESKSYYLQEVLKIKEIIEASKNSEKSYLFVLDEILKGTNTQERISSAKAIMSYINNSQHIVLVSTHDIELVTLLENEYELFHFSETIADNELKFDYKIKKGAVSTNNAIKILELYGYPKQIINDAYETKKKLYK